MPQTLFLRLIEVPRQGISRKEVSTIIRVDEDTVTEYVRRYVDGGLPRLLSDDYRRQKSRLDDHADHLREVFKAQPPHTVNEAIEVIARENVIRIKNSWCRSFLKKLSDCPRRSSIFSKRFC